VSPRPAEFQESEFEAAARIARSGRPADALQSVERALQASRDLEACAAPAAGALAEIAHIADEAGDASTAEQALEAALLLCPTYADLHFRYACVLLRRQRRAEARRALDTALRLNPRYLAARIERALLDAREGLVGEALEALRSLSRDQTMQDPRAFQQGMRSLERADWDEAEALLRRALDLEDGHLRRELQEVRSLLEAGDAARAVQTLRALIPRYGAYPDLHALLGRAELSLGHYDDALVALSRALELHPEYYTARVLLAQALECLGQIEQAQEQITLVLQRDPSHAEALERQRLWAERAARARRAAAAR
jgi:tetratricopeptide (TPR) repeat protein